MGSPFSRCATKRSSDTRFQPVAGIVVQFVVVVALLFGATGRWNWWQGWVFVGTLVFGIVASTFHLYVTDKNLFVERTRSPIQGVQPASDKVIVLLLVVTFYGSLFIAPIDVFRLHLLSSTPAFVSWLGLLLFSIGWSVASRASYDNTFAVPVVKYQPERRQEVVDTGLYRIVRHPMYAGGILIYLGIPLWLGSYATTAVSAIAVAALLVRILLEERFLRQTLPGYAAYEQRVRYRLIPLLW